MATSSIYQRGGVGTSAGGAGNPGGKGDAGPPPRLPPKPSPAGTGGNVLDAINAVKNQMPPNFQPAGLAQRQDFINSMLTQPGQVAPQSGGVNLGAAQTVSPAEIAALERATGVTLSPAERASLGSFGSAGKASAGALGAAAQAQGATVGPLSQATNSAIRGDLLNALQYQQGLMNGNNSVAALVAKQQRDQAMAQQLSMAAGGRPGQSALAARTAAQNMGAINNQLAIQEQQARLAERNQAAQQYAQLGLGISGQDISQAQFNAAQSNAYNQAVAQLLQQNQQFNAGQTNQQAQVGAGLQTQASVANAANQTQMGIAQGNAATQVNLANAAQANQLAAQQAALQQQTNLFNAGQANAQNLAQAQLNQQGGMFNASQMNAQNLAAAQLAQQNNQFNVGAQLQQTGLNNAQMANLLQAQLGGMGLQQQGTEFGANYGLNQAQLAQQASQFGQNLDFQKWLAQEQIKLQQQQINNQPSFLERMFSNLLGAGAQVAGPAMLAA